MGLGSAFTSTFFFFSCCCYVWLLVWATTGYRTVMAKECTNIPSQISHTLRAAVFVPGKEKLQSSSSSNISSHNISSSYVRSNNSFPSQSTPPSSSWKTSLSRGATAPHSSHSNKFKLNAPAALTEESLQMGPHSGGWDISEGLVVQKSRRRGGGRVGREQGQGMYKKSSSRGDHLYASFARRKRKAASQESSSLKTQASSSRNSNNSELTQGAPSLALKEVSLHRVTLAGDSLHGMAQETNLQYLLMLDVDNLVWSFRATAGLPTPGSPYGGWEHPEVELRGHFVGHFMSAAALMWASTHNEAIQQKMGAVVDALKECQDLMGTGYLSAFPSELFDRFEAISPVWAPYYTIHKIMAGLLDQYDHAGNEKALGMLLWMVEYFTKRVSAVIHKYTIEQHWTSLNEEVGGMNDVLYRLFMVTSDQKHLKLAHLFDKPCFLGLLSLQTDGLSGFHSNTHIPLVVGAQMRYEATGDQLYADLSHYFMNTINGSHRYATGGTSVSEFWTYPLRNGDALITETQETCTTYNMLKVARNIFRWTKNVAYADYYERTLVNGILSVQRGRDPGVMIYMLPEGPGSSKAVTYHGWGTPYSSFWCCYGTGVESFSKLGDSVYFEDIKSGSKLTVAQFVSSNVTWDAVGLLLRQKVVPLTSRDPYMHIEFDFHDLPKGANGKEAELSVRIPNWTTDASQIQLNGKSLGTPKPGSYFTISRSWKAGDVLLVDLFMTLMLEHIQDDRKQFSSYHGILYGPYVLAGMTDGDHAIEGVDTSSLSSWIVPVPSSYSSQLYTFSQDLSTLDDSQTPDLQFNVLSHKGGFAGMSLSPAKGSIDSARCTFLLTTSLMGTSDKFPPLGSLVSFELFSQPGKVLVHFGANETLRVGDESIRDKAITGSSSSSRSSGSSSSSRSSSKPDGKLEAAAAGSTSDLVLESQAGNSVFRLLGGLSGAEDSISIEAATMPGCYLTSGMDRYIRLRCQSKGTDEGRESDPNFDSRASFRVSRGIATYVPVSFIAKGANRQFLLRPLYAYMDERYTTYFNITSAASIN